MYCMGDFRFISAPTLSAGLRVQTRPIYAFLAGLPKEEDSPAKAEPLSCEDATVGTLAEIAAEFMAPYCEKCLRAGTLFRLDAATIARHGFTPEDITALRGSVDRCNAAAAARLQA